MGWGAIPTEPATVVGSSTVLDVAVAEASPSEARETGGELTQRISLLVPSRARLLPPARIVVRGDEMRVLGTQISPWPDAPSVVTCERINPDLPDDVTVLEVTGEALNDETGRIEQTTAPLWSGAAHITSGVPATVEAAGEDAPLEKVTITLPLAAPVKEGYRVRVVTARTPGVTGDDFEISGELLDSSGVLRRVVGYRLGR